jgi:NAD(P)-dependent dehydrogenase (short-subunit alcohol dehydrogenase family)
MINGFGEAAANDKLRREIAAAHGVRVAFSGADLSKPADATGLIEHATREFGRVDVLVNNAGIQHVAPVHEFPHDHEVAEATGSPVAAEALRRIGELYVVEARVRGQSSAHRLADRRSFCRSPQYAIAPGSRALMRRAVFRAHRRAGLAAPGQRWNLHGAHRSRTHGATSQAFRRGRASIRSCLNRRACSCRPYRPS